MLRSLQLLALAGSLLYMSRFSSVDGQPQVCPCRLASSSRHPRRKVDNITSNSLNICISNPPDRFDMTGPPGPSTKTRQYNFIQVDGAAEITDLLKVHCDVHILLSSISTDKLQMRQLCPNKCSPIPVAILPENLLMSYEIQNYRDHALTCSLTIGMILKQQRKHHLPTSTNSKMNLELMFIEVAFRLLQECKENYADTHSISVSSISGQRLRHQNRTLIRSDDRRKVEGVVIWIGSSNTMGTMKDQSMTLESYPYQGNDGVIGWTATELLYGCSEESTVCTQNGNYRYKYLPKSSMNLGTVGWRCAQRRPLRVLAHVLSLFDPTYIVLLDDDTYCNFPLLMERYSSALWGSMVDYPIYLGEYFGANGPEGHLSMGGIFAGGSGYILGHNVLTRLHRRAIYPFGYESWPSTKVSTGSVNPREVASKLGDSFVSGKQIQALSVLAESIGPAQIYCPKQRLGGGRIGSGSGSGRSPHHHLLVGNRSGNDATTDYNTCIMSMKGRPATPPRHHQQSHSSRRHHSAGSNHEADNNRHHHQRNETDRFDTYLRSATAGVVEAQLDPIPLQARLVDFCTTLMAGPHTCQHSDHSMGRCLLYAARAVPIGVTCHSQVHPLADVPAKYPIGMCFSAPTCNVSEQITCHRYTATRTARSTTAVSATTTAAGGGIVPVRNKKEASYYKVHSSMFLEKGRYSDTFMRR